VILVITIFCDPSKTFLIQSCQKCADCKIANSRLCSVYNIPSHSCTVNIISSHSILFIHKKYPFIIAHFMIMHDIHQSLLITVYYCAVPVISFIFNKTGIFLMGQDLVTAIFVQFDTNRCSSNRYDSNSKRN